MVEQNLLVFRDQNTFSFFFYMEAQFVVIFVFDTFHVEKQGVRKGVINLLMISTVWSSFFLEFQISDTRVIVK